MPSATQRSDRIEPQRPFPGTGNGRLARAGVTALLITALAMLGAAPALMPDSYDWVQLGVSESAAQGVEGTWLARTGFMLFGLGVLWLTSLKHRAWGRIGTVLHLGFGCSMFGVAAFSTKPWEDGAAYITTEDSLHSLYATTMGFCFILGVVAVMLARRLASTRQAIPDVVAIVITSSIPLMMSSSIWGLLQRLMFITAAAWYSREAWTADRTPLPDLTTGTDIATAD